MPNPTKRTLIPADPNDLVCDTCPERFPGSPDMYTTFERARVRGWHIYQRVQVEFSVSLGRTTDDPVRVDTRILCPACIGTPRTRLAPPPPVLEGQADILEDLDVQVEPVEKEKKPKKGKAVN